MSNRPLCPDCGAEISLWGKCVCEFNTVEYIPEFTSTNFVLNSGICSPPLHNTILKSELAFLFEAFFDYVRKEGDFSEAQMDELIQLWKDW